MRLFIGIDLPLFLEEKITNDFFRMRQFLSEAAYFTLSQNLHLTLVFLGEQPEEKVTAISQAMFSVSSRFSPFDLVINRCEIVFRFYSPKMIWLQFDKNSQILLQKFFSELVEELNKFQVEFKGTKEFNSHITLARFSQRWLRQSISKRDYIENLVKNIPMPQDIFYRFRFEKISLFLSPKNNGERIYRLLFESLLSG